MILRLSLITIALGIAWLSLTPKETITVGNDKISHFLAYGILMWNVGLLTFEVKRHFVIGALGCLAYGALMEFLQGFVPGRFVSLYDMFANSGGVIAGCLLTWISHGFLRKLFGKTRIF